MPARLEIDKNRIAAFCQKWKVMELSLFGSVLRDDFRADSDVDVLILLADDAPWSLYEWIDMIEELKAIFGRDVDLVEQSAIENPFRRNAIMRTREVMYAA